MLRTLLVHQEHWQSLGLLNFLQLASTPPAGAGEWEEEEEGLEVQGAEWAGEEGEEEEDGEWSGLGLGGAWGAGKGGGAGRRGRVGGAGHRM